MKSALNQNEIATLTNILFSNLDEDIFFSQISGFIHNQFEEYKTQIFEVMHDGSTLLRSENGQIVQNAKKEDKGQGLSSYVARVKRAYYSNSKRDPLLSNMKRDAAVETELCVPVISEGTIIATINIQSNKEDRKFTDADVAIINGVLKELESPLKNMKMYLLAKNLNKELMEKIALKEKELASKGATSSKVIEAQEKNDLIGHSQEFVKILSAAKKLAAEDLPVMIIGEAGTGKKSIAKRIHELSNRKNASSIVVHCGALGSQTAEIELFGETDKPGLVEAANGGTLILDDVASLNLDIQKKLLKVLVSGEIFRVGSKIAQSVNVRIISTSKNSLSKLAEEGKFLEALLYRLNTVSLNMPSLRERQEDIKILAEHFLNAGKKIEDNKMLTSVAIERLTNASWQGNIRELRNVMERTAILTDGRYVDESNLPELTEIQVKEERTVEVKFEEMTLQDLEKLHIVKTLGHLGGNKTRAAKALGVTVKTLYNKLHAYGLLEEKAE